MNLTKMMKVTLFMLTMCLLGIGLYAQEVEGSAIDDQQLNLTLEYLQSMAKQEGYTFSIGKTSVSNLPIERLAGLKEPEGWQKTAKYDGSNLSEAAVQATLPTTFDWRLAGKVTPVKNQGTCGACWAFGSIAAYESAILIAGGPVEDLSEEYLLDCNNLGYSCNGGWFDVFNNFVGGIPKEACYPYSGMRSSCQTGCSRYYPSKSWAYVGSGNAVPSVADLKNAIYTHGPLSVGIYTDSYLQNYTGGIFTNTSYASSPNHNVVIVGWNDSTGTWIVKNSWGTGWGESGYVRIAYGANLIGYGACYAIPTVNNGGNYTLNINTSGIGTVSMSPAGGTYAPGTVVTLTAVPGANSSFSRWTGDLNSTSNPITITMNGNKNVTANFTGTGVQYCASYSQGSNEEWISAVSIGTMTNYSGATNYTDFTSKVVTANRGGSLVIKLTPGFSGSPYNEYWKVYIDYNRNGVFTDANETVFTSAGSSARSGRFTVPTSALTGNTRIRVVMRYGSYQGPCGSFPYGEVEDYTISIR